MNFDVSAVHRKRRKFLPVNDLRLKMFFDTVKDAIVDPASKTLINGVPFPKVLGDGTPSTPIFGNVLQCSKKGEVVNFYIPPLLRQSASPCVTFA